MSIETMADEVRKLRYELDAIKDYLDIESIEIKEIPHTWNAMEDEINNNKE